MSSLSLLLGLRRAVSVERRGRAEAHTQVRHAWQGHLSQGEIFMGQVQDLHLPSEEVSMGRVYLHRVADMSQLERLQVLRAWQEGMYLPRQ